MYIDGEWGALVAVNSLIDDIIQIARMHKFPSPPYLSSGLT